MTRVGVLASGSGSNFQALVDGLFNHPDATLAVLVCNVANAKALDRARSAGIEAICLEHSKFASREAFDTELVETLRARNVDLVCLAGYMRLVTPGFLRAFPNRVLNVHPALLPAFPGIHGARQALAYGVRITGCTVHVVDEGTDTGPIIAQAAVNVLPNDTELTLGARIQGEEHRLFPRVVQLWAEGKIRLDGRRVTVTEPI